MELKNVSLLLVEDNREHAQLLRQMLAKSTQPSFRLVHYDRLRPALERMRMPGIDMILLDLSLPDSDGIDTFLNTQAAAPETPIVVLSGTDDEALAMETVQHGAQDYLVKGQVDHRSLIRALRYAQERKRAEQDLRRAHDELEKRVAERTADLVRANEKLQSEIVERKRAQADLRENNRQLADALRQKDEAQKYIIQRERLHALGSMATGIAHDFNNALAPILGFSELLLLHDEVLKDVDKVRDYLRMIHDSAEESAKIVARLREFYRYREDTESLAPVSIDDLINQAISLTQPKWKDQALARGATIRVKTELHNVPTVAGNESALREMLTNLIFNAVDAIQDSGTITFRTFVRENYAVVQVIDTGFGMSAEVREHCLEPFFSTKQEHGTGLGLGIVYGIVRRHDGAIEIDSAPGKGTTFTISLPLYKEEKPSAAAPVMDGPNRSLRILIVEDEPLVREVITMYLSEDHHEVDVAENGLEGLAKFRPGRYDIVLTDRAMPEMNGDVLASEIKKIDKNQPVILLTGFGELMTGAGERPAGVDLIVSKPFTLNVLREAIAKGLEMRAAA